MMLWTIIAIVYIIPAALTGWFLRRDGYPFWWSVATGVWWFAPVMWEHEHLRKKQ